MKRTGLGNESSRSSATSTEAVESKFVVCITDSEPDLQMRRIYQVLPDESAARSHYLRIIDESGEDYLYPASHFAAIQVPKEVEVLLKQAS